MDSVHDNHAGVEPITGLCRFRDEFYSCLGARADAQFELTETLLCADGPVRSLVDLSLTPEHRRGHGALYDGLNHGSIEIGRLRRGVAGLPLPRVGDRIVLAADVSPWLRPDAETSPAHRRHPDPAAGRPSPRRPRPETAVAVDQRPDHDRPGHRP